MFTVYTQFTKAGAVRIINLAGRGLETYLLRILCVCVCVCACVCLYSCLNYSACKAHAPYYIALCNCV